MDLERGRGEQDDQYYLDTMRLVGLLKESAQLRQREPELIPL